MESSIVYWGYWDNGEESGSYYDILRVLLGKWKRKWNLGLGFKASTCKTELTPFRTMNRQVQGLEVLNSWLTV